jgi:hypothetical protein
MSMKIVIVNANSGATRECQFECFHGGKRSPWAELRFGVAGVYNFSLNTGWQERRKGQPQDWYVGPADLEVLRKQAGAEKVKFKAAVVQAPNRTDAKPRKARGKQAAPPAQRSLFNEQ